MRIPKKYYAVVAVLLLGNTLLWAQPLATDTQVVVTKSEVVATPERQSSPFVVGNIYIEGNKRTKPYIIARELPFKTGDSIYLPELVAGFEVSRRQLFNTGLFNEVVVALKSFRGYEVDIIIQVKERWYFFPIPYVKPVDRNLSEWSRQGYGVNRLNYGIKFTQYNFTGRNDKLKFWLLTGYTKKFEFQYDQPYADKTLRHGYGIGFSYSFNREINYATVKNQQMFTDSLTDGIKRWEGKIEYTYRPGLRTFHAVRLSVVREQVDSQLLDLNPKYYTAHSSAVTYPELAYNIKYVNVDYVHFPLTGWVVEAGIVKRGINKDMNMWQINAKINKGWQVAKKTYYALQANGVLRVPFDQPYINHRMFGYGDMFLRGLERYVIDGVGGILTRSSLRRELVRFNIRTHLKSKSHDRIPFRIYARTFGDMGYAYNKNFTNNSLTNRMLYTGGFGLDIVTFYDFILRFDYSFNQLGQNGLFLHVKNDF
jgi:outer membrane protein assembly factor BamA